MIVHERRRNAKASKLRAMARRLESLLYFLGQGVLWVTSALVAAIAALSLLGYFGGLGWQIAFLSSPRAQFAVLAFVAGIGFGIRRYKTMAVVAAMTTLLNLIILAPFLWPSQPSGRSETDFTVAHANTNAGSADLQDLIADTPDILLVQEVTPAFETSFDALDGYTVVASSSSDDTKGSAILVADALAAKVEAVDAVETTSKRTMLAIEIDLGDRTVVVLSAHTTRPDSSGRNKNQLDELSAIAEWSVQTQGVGTDVLVVGDMNTVPWSARYQKLLHNGDLQDSMEGDGLQTTWPASLPGVLGVPIDNAAHTTGIVVRERSTIDVEGSDHAGLTFQVAVVRYRSGI